MRHFVRVVGSCVRPKPGPPSIDCIRKSQLWFPRGPGCDLLAPPMQQLLGQAHEELGSLATRAIQVAPMPTDRDSTGYGSWIQSMMRGYQENPPLAADFSAPAPSPQWPQE